MENQTGESFEISISIPEPSTEASLPEISISIPEAPTEASLPEISISIPEPSAEASLPEPPNKVPCKPRRRPFGFKHYSWYLWVAAIIVVGSHAFTFFMSVLTLEPSVKTVMKPGEKLTYTRAIGLHFSYLTTWSAIAVEAFIIYSIVLTYGKEHSIRTERWLQRILSSLLFLGSVMQCSIIPFFWIGQALMGEPLGPMDLFQSILIHGVVGAAQLVAFFTTSIVIYASDFLLLVLIVAANTVVNIVFTLQVIQIYPGMDWKNDPGLALQVLFSFFGFVAFFYGLLLFIRWLQNLAIFRIPLFLRDPSKTHTPKENTNHSKEENTNQEKEENTNHSKEENTNQEKVVE